MNLRSISWPRRPAASGLLAAASPSLHLLEPLYHPSPSGSIRRFGHCRSPAGRFFSALPFPPSSAHPRPWVTINFTELFTIPRPAGSPRVEGHRLIHRPTRSRSSPKSRLLDSLRKVGSTIIRAPIKMGGRFLPFTRSPFRPSHWALVFPSVSPLHSIR